VLREGLLAMKLSARVDLASKLSSPRGGRGRPPWSEHEYVPGAVLDGVHLGRPTSTVPNPRIGEVPLPARGVLAIAQAAWRIRDPDEYSRMVLERTRTAA
jgi:hypothetical protein